MAKSRVTTQAHGATRALAAAAYARHSGGGKSHLAPRTRGRRIVISHYACAVSTSRQGRHVQWLVAGAVVFAYFFSFHFYILSVLLGRRERTVGLSPDKVG